MFIAHYVDRTCPGCGAYGEHLVCGHHGSRMISCMNCEYIEEESNMKNSYKLIEHHEISESARKKKGIAVLERTSAPSGYFNGASKTTVDTIEVSYPIWDDDHFTGQVQLAGGGHLDHVATKDIAKEIDRLVKPKEDKGDSGNS